MKYKNNKSTNTNYISTELTKALNLLRKSKNEESCIEINTVTREIKFYG